MEKKGVLFRWCAAAADGSEEESCHGSARIPRPRERAANMSCGECRARDKTRQGALPWLLPMAGRAKGRRWGPG